MLEDAVPTSPVAARALGAPRVIPDWKVASVASLSLVGFPLVSILPVALGMPSRPISIVFRILVFGLATLVVGRLVAGREKLANRVAFMAFAVFWAMLLLRIVWEATGRMLPLPLPWSEMFANALMVSLLPALALMVVVDAGTFRLALRQMEMLGAVALVGLGVLGVRTLLDVSTLTRLSTEVLNPTSIGHLALTTLLVTSYRLATERARATWKMVLRVLLLLTALVVMLAAASKGPVLAAAIIGLVVVIVRSAGQGRPAAVFVGVAGAAVLAVALLFVAQWVEETTSLRTTSRFVDVLYDPSTSVRTSLLRGAFDQFAESPLIGNDIVERRLRAYPHNFFLEALMTTGIVGFAPFLLFNALGFLAACRLLAGSCEARWVGLLSLQYQVSSIVAGSLIYGGQFWAMLAFVVAADHRARNSGDGNDRGAA